MSVPEGRETPAVVKVDYWRCKSCGHIVTMDASGNRHNEPTGCGVCEGGGAWDHLGEDFLTTTQDIHTVRGF